METQNSRYKWEVLIIVMIGTMMAALDSSIVNVSVPNIMADFGVGVDDIEWIITGYMLAFASLMPLTAWLRDRIGHKSLYAVSLIVFTLGSVLCGLAWDLPSLIVARVIQALGGGAITPTGMAMITEVFEPEERGKALGYWGVGVIAGPAIGPTLGGFLTEWFGWRSIFLVNLPIGIIGLVMAMKMLRKDVPQPHQRRAFDTWGFFFFTTFLISFLLGVSKGEHEGWLSNYIITCGIIAVLGFIGFMLVETQVENRIIDITLFKNGTFTMAMVVTMVRSLALYGGTFLLPLFLQQIQGLEEVDSGLLMLPGSLVLAMLMPVGGRLSDKMGARLLTITGLVLLGVFMFLYKDLDVNTSKWGIIYPTLIRGVGLALMISPISALAMNSVPKHKAGMASSMMNIMQQIGGSLGIAILSMVLSHRMHYHLGIVGENLANQTGGFARQAAILRDHVHSLGYTWGQSQAVSQGLLIRDLNLKSMVLSFLDSFLVGALIVAGCVFIAFFLPKGKVKVDPEVAAME
jgi:EmrB/QacA subfamily drug resistance transporter